MQEERRTDAEILDAVERAARKLRNQEILLAIASFAVGLGYLVVMLAGRSADLRDFVTRPGAGQWEIVGWYLFLFTLIYNVVHLPVSFLRGYVIEKRFRLSQQRFRRWLWSQAKRFLVSALMIVALGEAVYFFLRFFDKGWWFWAWLLYLVFGLLLARYASRVLIPLFYKKAEIENAEVVDHVERIVDKAGFELKSVKCLILEKDTRRANAAVLGMGAAKEILLSDTLLATLGPAEIEAVVAHEIGHLRRHHREMLFGAGMVVSFVAFVFAAGALEMSKGALEIADVYDVAGFPLIVLVFSGLFLMVTPVLNYISRIMEHEADVWAFNLTGDVDALATALDKLAAANLAERNQPWLYEILFSTHPSPANRIEYMKEAAKRNPPKKDDIKDPTKPDDTKAQKQLDELYKKGKASGTLMFWDKEP